MTLVDLDLIRSTLARDPRACRELVARLTPVIQQRVNAALIRRRRGTRQEVVDLTQEVFRILLDKDGHVLRAWDPAKGASLEGYVGMVAERRVASILVSGRKSGWAEDAVDLETLDRVDDPQPGPEDITSSREVLGRLLDVLRAQLNDRAYQMFVWLHVEEREVAWVMATAGLSRDAVYAWRSRLQKVVHAEARKMSSEENSSPGRSRGEAAR